MMGPLAMDLYLPGLTELAGDLRAPASGSQLTITAYLVGLAVGQLAAGPVTDWRGTFVVLSGIGILLLLAAWTWLPETLEPERRRVGGAAATRRAMAALLHDRSFVAITACIGLSFAMLTVYLAGSVFLLEDIHGVSPQMFGVIFTFNSALMMCASQVSADDALPMALLITATSVAAAAALVVGVNVRPGGGPRRRYRLRRG